MKKLKTKFSRVLNNGAKHRVVKAIWILSTFLFLYQMIPKILWKTPPTFIGLEDPDFHNWPDNKEIVILHWTAIFKERSKTSLLDGQTCEALNRRYFSPNIKGSNLSQMYCRVTFDRRYLSRSNVLLFHSFDLMYEDLPMETQRRQDQLWVWLQLESPIYTRANLQMFPNVFNWTMTYRRDSDVYSPYSMIVHRKIPVNNSVVAAKRMLPQKTRLIAWVVSSCDSYSRREVLVEALQKYIPVDVYGWCGIGCPKHGSCYNHVGKTHKFYLSFENSLCTDYITEKFFDAMSSTMVPIVYGGLEESDYSAIAPPHSYIDMRSFKSIEDLAKYLTYLDKNDTAYLEYFKWKDKYEVAYVSRWCELCQKVYSQSDQTGRKWYNDIWRWWNYQKYETVAEMRKPEERIDHAYANQPLGPKICTSPNTLIRNLTASASGSSPDFEPSLFNGRLLSKYLEWAIGFA